MFYTAFLGLLAVQAAQATAQPDSVDPLSAFTGDWRIVNTDSDEVVQDCAKAQSFAVASDRKTIVLTEKWNDNWTARYMVLHKENGRVLTFVENETRTTDSGDPILWWAYFDGPDRFRWRRYDWGPNEGTTTEWQRCPKG